MLIQMRSLKELVDTAYSRKDVCGVEEIREYKQDNKIICEVIWCEGCNEAFYVEFNDYEEEL